MTGGEMLPVAEVVGGAVKMAFNDSADKDALKQLAVESPNMRAAAESYARRVAVKQAVLLRVYQPLGRFVGVSREYFDTQFAEDLARKVEQIPDERITTPSPAVAIPAMQGLAYSVGEPNLKEMYLSLLATATDDLSADDAHPSFAEVIKQLSPAEADLLLDTLARPTLPVVRVNRMDVEGPGEVVALNYLLPLVAHDGDAPSENPRLGVWIDNWLRLGLIGVDFMRELVDDAQYAYVNSRPEVEKLSASDARGIASLRFQRGILFTTDFGRRFRAAVSYDGVPVGERTESA